ncbi:MAG: cohesin domain-containing protein [Nitrososphaeria archaeon]
MRYIKSEPTIIGKFKANIKIYKVTDLYTWQVSIKYNQSELKVLEIIPGDFLGDDQVFTNSTDSFPNVLMVMGSLKGPTSGKSGDGTLAVIIFGYYTVNYTKPVIINEGFCKTILLNSNECDISFELFNSNGDHAHLALILK